MSVKDLGLFTKAVRVKDHPDGKRVNVTVEQPVKFAEAPRDTVIDTAARGRAVVAAGFAPKGFLRDINLRIKSPKLERKTEIVNREEIEDGIWDYDIVVRSGVIFS